MTSELIRRLEALNGSLDGVAAASLANSFGPWECETDEWHLLVSALRGSVDSAIALAERLLDNGSVDIEVAHRSVGGIVHGRAEICGPHVDSAAKAATPAIALCLAVLKATEHDR